MKTEIPIVDISPLPQSKLERLDSQARRTVGEISGALREFGFFYVTGHGISRSLQDNLFTLFQSFFSQSLDDKMAIAMKHAGHAWRGYFPPGGELTLGRPDRKEGIYFGREPDVTTPPAERDLPMHGANLWPSGSAHVDLEQSVLNYMQKLTDLGQTLLGAIALGLHLPHDYFLRRFTDRPTVLFRAFNYPKHTWAESDDEWGVREHTDYGFLTILNQDASGGLQVKRRSGQWIDAPPIENAFVINIGDMLEVWTHGIYRSTPHRVRNRGSGDRLSMPFFFDPNWHSTLEPISRSSLPKAALAGVGSETIARWDGLNLKKLSRDLTYGTFIWEKVRQVFPDL